VCRLHSLLTLNRAVANIGRRGVSVVGWGGGDGPAGPPLFSPSADADAAHYKKMFFFLILPFFFFDFTFACRMNLL
jgi:hypothetical protein